ncbi:NADH-quinone oxidoreductase subunit N [Rufibacter latericius]|uniref:NADH-quinone oxidoreductase subunit N n=1 Tax=Rufibacter latericius TaxID=2487040 RepID=A0A3M9ML49_9BACT|nr:NADH-quinone oxidoreductase subunit N [Rufibacter latericius]RNI26264.1 NADH-quinone oxidoreductase subunit N [Rufibacter latericius]
MTSIILLSIFGILNLFVGFMKSKKVLMPVVLLFLAVSLGATLFDWNQPQSYFSNMLATDNFSVGFTAVMVLSTLFILPFSRSYVVAQNSNLAEYYSLLLFALVGGIMMVSYENLLILFVGIEIMSISMYIIAGSDKRNILSNEASMKYFLMGSFFTGIILFGIALLYGATGAFYLTDIAAAATNMDPATQPLLLMGLLLVLIGVTFKIGAAPFHFWTPDVYEGTPTVFTSYMSTVVKTAGIAAFYKLMSAAFGGVYDQWFPTVVAITVLTLLIGNIGAVAQTSMKRMLAYSSISHAGYLMIALTAFNDRSENALLFYSLAYAIATIAAFGILKYVGDARGSDDYTAFNGLGKTNPLLAFVMTVSMLSLAGIPLTGGFFGKLFLFSAALEQDMIWLIIIAVLMSAVGIYYYFRVIIAMYMRDAEGARIAVDPLATFTLISLVVLTVLMGIVPGLFNDLL